MNYLLPILEAYEIARTGPGKLSRDAQNQLNAGLSIDDVFDKVFRILMNAACATADQTHKDFLIAHKQWYAAERAVGRSGLLKDMDDQILADRIKNAM